MARNSATDRSNMNKIYKPIAGYVANVVKEGGQAVKAWSNALDASDKAKYGTRPGPAKEAAKRAATAASKKQDAEQGQFLGALLQGRRYTPGGTQIKKLTTDRNPKGIKKMDLDKKARGKK